METIKTFLLALDQSIYFFFQNLQTEWLHYLLAWPTDLGRMEVAFGLVCVAILWMDKGKGFLKIPTATFCIWGNHYLSGVLKEVFSRPRPFLIWDQAQVIFGKADNGAFPSGHAATAFAAAYLLDGFYPGKMRWTYLVAVWISVTRLYVGVHYFTDLIGGAMLGISSAAVALWLHRGITYGVQKLYVKKNSDSVRKS